MGITSQDSKFKIQDSRYWRILKKTIPVLFSGFKNPYQTIHEKRKLESLHE
jgi:hypothetical protein